MAQPLHMQEKSAASQINRSFHSSSADRTESYQRTFESRRSDMETNTFVKSRNTNCLTLETHSLPARSILDQVFQRGNLHYIDGITEDPQNLYPGNAVLKMILRAKIDTKQTKVWHLDEDNSEYGKIFAHRIRRVLSSDVLQSIKEED